MHVLILNQTFYPDWAATAQLMWDLAQYLARQGHRVSAITSRQVYGTDHLFDKARETVDGVEILRVKGTAFGKKRLIGRLGDGISFYAAALYTMDRLPPPDVILVLTSPPMVATLAMLAKQLRRQANGRPVRIVYHIMDVYPEAAVAHGLMRPDSLAAGLMARVTRRNLDLSDAMIVLGHDMKDLVLRHYGLHHRSSDIHIVQPWADGAALRPVDKCCNPLARSLGLDRTFNIVYSGNLGIAHDLQTLVAGIDAMRHDADVRWTFIGGGKRFDALKAQADRSAWPHVRLLPYQERQMLAQSLSLADVHLVSQLPAFTGVVVPSKLFGIMAVGRPSVMVGPENAECSRILKEHQAGFVVPNGRTDLLVQRLRQLKEDAALRQDMGRRAREAFELHYDRPIACAKIESVLRDAANRGMQ